MKLSEAILKGCEMTPKQAFLVYGEPGKATCVMGAALEGAGVGQNVLGWPVPESVFDRLDGSTFGDLPCAGAPRLRDQLTGINDGLRWSREKIAAALAERGL